MPNEKNLVPFTSSQSREKAVKNGRKGGKASGQAKRTKKTLREYADFLFSLEVTDGRKFNKLTRAGVPVEGCDNKMLMVFGLMQAAQGGDVAAAKELRNIIGEDKLPDGDTGQSEAMKHLTGAIKEAVKNDN